MEYNCQKRAKSKRDDFIFIPENTVIKKEVLTGLDNKTFVKCFRHLQEMGRSVFDDMIINFADYGINSKDDKNNNIVSCFGDVLYQIALLGELDNGSLTVNIAAFKNGSKKYKFNMIINKLRENGFEITNHNGKTFAKGAETFEVSYPAMPEILNALKGYALLYAKYLEDTPSTYRFYKTNSYNFICFQYRFVEDETTREFPEPAFMIKTDRYSDDCKKAMFWWYKEAAKHGYRLGTGFSEVVFKKGSKSFLPLEISGEKMMGCAYHSFKFNDIKFENLPLIVDLFKTEFGI